MFNHFEHVSEIYCTDKKGDLITVLVNLHVISKMAPTVRKTCVFLVVITVFISSEICKQLFRLQTCLELYNAAKVISLCQLKIDTPSARNSFEIIVNVFFFHLSFLSICLSACLPYLPIPSPTFEKPVSFHFERLCMNSLSSLIFSVAQETPLRP